MKYSNPNLDPKTIAVLNDIEKKFIKMRASGETIRDIAKKLNKSTHTICDWNKKYFHNIIEIQSSEFRELQKKIINYKTARLDFLKQEFDNVKKSLAKRNLAYEKDFWRYDDYLNLILRLSDIMDKFEFDMLTMAGNHKTIRAANVLNTENEEGEIVSVANSVSTTKNNDVTNTNTKQIINKHKLKK